MVGIGQAYVFMYREQLAWVARLLCHYSLWSSGSRCRTFSHKMHIYCITLRKENRVYLPIRCDFLPYKIPQCVCGRGSVVGNLGELTSYDALPSRLSYDALARSVEASAPKRARRLTPSALVFALDHIVSFSVHVKLSYSIVYCNLSYASGSVQANR